MPDGLTIYGTHRGMPIAMYTAPLPGNWPMATRDVDDVGRVAYQYALSTFDVWPELWQWVQQRRKLRSA